MFGQLSIDPVSRDVVLCGEKIPLSTSDFDLLWLLASHAGETLNRDLLLKEMRGVDYDGLDRSIDVAISRLRKKLGDNPSEPFRIKTVRNRGYLFSLSGWE
ncbi:Transcriptional regulatory protein RstA [Chromobacterium violaceum]|uniref:Transcriptional regulatory protein RstA n=1 Tax=Chromobacterium violaceum TaxID=536 RepID=A0A447TJQ1_CHRVL|nr:Transcriptional regulatory protein RstA [Chromobacterium violaceum]